MHNDEPDYIMELKGQKEIKGKEKKNSIKGETGANNSTDVKMKIRRKRIKYKSENLDSCGRN